MAKFNIPDRKYCAGAKKMVSMRLPDSLVGELQKLAEQKGWTMTDLVQTILDQFIQWEEAKKKNR